MNEKAIEYRHDISIVISGEAGQGIQTLEELTATAAKSKGYHVFTYSEVMSRIRGGNNSTEIRISSKRVDAYVRRIDLFIPLNERATDRFRDRITENTSIIGDRGHVDCSFTESGCSTLYVSRQEIIDEAGNIRYFNSAVFGFLCGLMEINETEAGRILSGRLKSKDESNLKKNAVALAIGYRWRRDPSVGGRIALTLAPSESAKTAPRFYGSEAVGIGALAGGCNFLSSYPMSPSTEVLTFMAAQAARFGVVVEQAEDEICAINMAIGSWYAGGRAMVTTSGGGFALMCEGVSLAGMSETPLVVHVGQRPGPATGLPTRTEQGDLNLVLHAGHGEFPRAIFAPGTREDAVELTCRAFSLADRYQVPVFILTDQFLLDSSALAPDLDTGRLSAESHIISTEMGYARYAFTESGVSPRGIPGHGEGIVCSASDEHDEGGYITEDFGLRVRMMDKRMKKEEHLVRVAEAPRLYGPEEYRVLVVCWGSTVTAIREAREKLKIMDLSVLHFRQVYPLHPETAGILSQADHRILVENNATGQFGRLLTLHTGITFQDTVLKYDGMPFSVEEVADSLSRILNRKHSGGEKK